VLRGNLERLDVGVDEGEAALRAYVAVPPRPDQPRLDVAWWRLGQLLERAGKFAADGASRNVSRLKPRRTPPRTTASHSPPGALHMSEAIVRLQGVTKRFAGHTAVNRLSLEIPRGGIFGLLGPNGAGKSTSIRMMMSIILPDEGSISVFGRQASRETSDRIGFLPEERGLYKKMDVLEHLIFLGNTKSLSRHDARTRALQWLERLGLRDWSARKVEDLSKGMQQKVQFIGTLLHEPELVVLDEPFSGLDPVNSQVMRDTVVDLARQGRTVLFSTHIMEQAERMCDRIAIIARGEKVVDGRLADVKREFGGQAIQVAFSGGAELARRVLQDRSLVARMEDYGASAELELTPSATPTALLQALLGSGAELAKFEVVEPSLQQIFIAKVGHTAATAPAREVAHV
jgi:ABC-2 type transport system ATP-binding protein